MNITEVELPFLLSNFENDPENFPTRSKGKREEEMIMYPYSLFQIVALSTYVAPT